MNSNNRYYYFLGAIVITSLVISPFIMNYINKSVDKVRPMSEQFMTALLEGKFEDANKYTNKHFQLETDFAIEGRIESFDEVGCGTEPGDIIRIEYLVEGFPSEKRNISLEFNKINENWKITNYTISYHINRNDKANAISFLEDILNGNPDKAYQLMRDFDHENFKEISRVIQQYRPHEKWIITKAVNDPCFDWKDCNRRPNRTKLHFQSPDAKYLLYFICCNKNDEHWIKSVEIVE